MYDEGVSPESDTEGVKEAHTESNSWLFQEVLIYYYYFSRELSGMPGNSVEQGVTE